MKQLKSFLNLFCVMFTVIALTYYVFSMAIHENKEFTFVSQQVIGLALIFTTILATLDTLSNTIKWLNGKMFVFIQYLTLLVTIVLWASNFQWGNWSDKGYVSIFILSFSIIYIFIYFMLDSKNKKEDRNLLNNLKYYQKKNNL